ncbi:MAG: TIR domain-containing protein [Promethearchaeota archaeon]
MKIAIFGSFWEKGDMSPEINNEWKLIGTSKEFATTCFNLGKKIAKFDHSVIVGSSVPHTADNSVVMGLIEEIKDKEITRPLVKVMRPKYKSPPFELSSFKYPDLFLYASPKQPFWEAAHLMAIRDADAICIIGGAKRTYNAGLAALMSKKRLVPIGCHGGAAEKLLDVIDTIEGFENKNEYMKLRGPWSEKKLDIVLKLLGIYEYPKLMIIHGRSKDWVKLKEYLTKVLEIPEPIIMGEKFGLGKTLPEKFEYLASHVDGVIAIATSDDIGGLAIDQNEENIPMENVSLNRRARQNVWLEVGWGWGHFGRKNIMILRKGDIEAPSDLAGIEVYIYNEDPLEKAEQIKLFIESLREF